MKTVDFSETIAAVGRCRQLIDFIKIYVSIDGQGPKAIYMYI